MRYKVIRGVSYTKPGSDVELHRWEPGDTLDTKDVLAIRPKLDPPLDIDWLVEKGVIKEVGNGEI